jgi:glutathione-independent formaldehyde dehydrogenase
VGLLSASCSGLQGASEIYLADSIREGLAKAKELGATPVDFSKGDPVEQIFELRERRTKESDRGCARARRKSKA